MMPSQKLKSLDRSRNVFVGQPGLELLSKRRCTPLALLILLVSSLLSFPCASLHAQANTGLTGRVTDPSGAAIPGAHITFVNEATGIRTQAAASSVGLYTANLTAGTYDIRVEAAGFKQFEQTHVVVEVGAEATDDIKLTMGSVDQTVEVSSLNTIHMDTTDPQLDSVLPTEEVTDLPLEINGYMRQITSFATLAPGVRNGQYGSVTIEGGASGQINSAGNYYNGVQLDTASDINSDPPYEMVDQFRVIRNAFSARYGMVQGAVDYNMRSGTNKLHGDAFYIARNSVFDSAGFFPSRFDSAGNALAPIDNERDWGGTIGGPVVLPRLYNGHNKTFFLFSIDIFKKDAGITTFGTVPTPAMKTGDFSKFVDTKGNLIPIYDPQTGQQFQCNGQLNVICPDRIDPLSKSLLQYIPDPNATGTNFGLQGNAKPAITSVPNLNNALGVTVNHQISQSQNIAFTWWRNHYFVTQEEDAPIVPVTNPLTGQEELTDNANVWLANYSKIMRPNLVMTAGFAAQDKFQNNENTNNNVNFPGIVNSNQLPYISFNGQNAPTNWGNSNSSLVRYYVDNKGWNFFNNWMWNKGRHTVNFGGEFHHYWETTLSNYSSGHFSFSQAETSTVPSNSNFSQYGSSFASFLLGLPDSASRTAATTTAVHTNAVSFYVQDDFKLTSKLTLNAGLRYDLMIPYSMDQNNNVFLAPNTPNPAAGNLPGAATQYGNCQGCAGFNRVGIHDLYFGPRLGFAYSVDRNTVIQGGYTLTYLGYNGAYGQGEGLSGPINSMAGLLGGSYTLNGTGGNTSAYGQWTNAGGGANPIPAVTPTPFNPGLGVAQTIYYLDYHKNGEAPMLQMWSLSVQRQIPWHTMLTIDYTGNRVTHLSGYNRNPISQPDPSVLKYGSLLTQNINSAAAKAAGFTAPYPTFAAQFGGGATVLQALKPFPQYSSVARAWDQAGTTYFSAFQIQADKHLSNNINFLASIELPRLYDNLITTVNKYNQRPDWGLDSTGSFESKLALLYQLPFGPGQRWLNRGETGRLLGGWQVSGIVTYNNSQPLAIVQSGGSPLVSANRPNFNPGVKLWSGNYGQITQFFEGKGPAPVLFSTNAWSLTAPTGSQYVLGNANRVYNAVRGPWYPVENLSVKKLFRITEGTSFTVRMDYFNAFNRVQAPFPNTTFNSSGFGQVTSKFSPVNRQGQ
ncbi:MAG TPA: TonB-dependent receptor, partial [Acidobacteriaceae bacterium]|nr:TonB-dependent receptor [Acidobacteriaceae bacterium]